jgi:hypothetical protein
VATYDYEVTLTRRGQVTADDTTAALTLVLDLETTRPIRRHEWCESHIRLAREGGADVP